jgi:hypothetical protein
MRGFGLVILILTMNCEIEIVVSIHTPVSVLKPTAGAFDRMKGEIRNRERETDLISSNI